ncbi:MAG: UDP-N-acetylglucosamine 1-carboxyvinyltransferase [Brumimicrobium sp.]
MKYPQKIHIFPGKLSGTVVVSGAKNSALRMLAASLLTKESITLTNFPTHLLDVQIHIDMLRLLGKEVDILENSVIITESKPLNTELNWNERSIRNTLLILGALTARFGEAKVPLPEGCKLGDRKFDLHFELITKLGAAVWQEKNQLFSKSNQSKLQGTTIELHIRSTGATENALLCAVLAEGKTEIINPHLRPEILDLIELLSKMGAEIKVNGSRSITILGVSSLQGAEHEVIPDNAEAITWAVAAAITNSEIKIKNFPKEQLEAPLLHLRKSGLTLNFQGSDAVVGKCNISPVEIATGPYPGINSDIQPVMALYGATSIGTTMVTDLRFKNRYQYLYELQKMGMEGYVEDNTLYIATRGRKLFGAEVEATDIRTGITLLLAGLIADKKTTINNAWQIFRGYNNLLEKMDKLNIKYQVE